MALALIIEAIGLLIDLGLEAAAEAVTESLVEAGIEEETASSLVEAGKDIVSEAKEAGAEFIKGDKKRIDRVMIPKPDVRRNAKSKLGRSSGLSQRDLISGHLPSYIVAPHAFMENADDDEFMHGVPRLIPQAPYDSIIDEIVRQTSGLRISKTGAESQNFLYEKKIANAPMNVRNSRIIANPAFGSNSWNARS